MDEFDRLLSRQSGVRAIAGEADMLMVARRGAAGDPAALLARQIFAYRVAGCNRRLCVACLAA